MTKEGLLYKELTYKINGVCFEVHNTLGRYKNEKQYADMLEELLKRDAIYYEREKILPQSFPGERPGRNRVDFLIENTIVLELKAKHFIERVDYHQVLRYLESLNKKLGLLINFKERRLKIRRILNTRSNELKSDPHIRVSSPSVNPCMEINIKRLKEDAILPKYAHPGDVGLDLYSLEDRTLKPGERHIFYVGFAMEFPVGYAAIVKDKSSVSSAGLHIFGGVYDAGYRGEYNVGLANLGQDPYDIQKGQKLAQLVIFPVAIADIKEVNELSDSARGTGGFGSTGKF